MTLRDFCSHSLGTLRSASEEAQISLLMMKDHMVRKAIPVYHQWTIRLFAYPGYCKYFNGHGEAYFFKLMFSFSFHKYSEMELLDHMVLFSIVAAPTDIPTKSAQGLLLYILPNSCYSSLFYNRYSNRC